MSPARFVTQCEIRIAEECALRVESGQYTVFYNLSGWPRRQNLQPPAYLRAGRTHLTMGAPLSDVIEKGIHMSAKNERLATIARGTKALTVSVPTDLKIDDLRVITDSIVAQIERLTGHPCLSGTHDVILRNQFEDVVQVKLH